MENIEVFKEIMRDDIRPVLIYSNKDNQLFWNNAEAEKANLNYAALREIECDENGECVFVAGGFRCIGNIYKEMFEGYTIVIFKADEVRSFFASKAFADYSKDCSDVIRRSVTGISFCVNMLNEMAENFGKKKEDVYECLDSIIKNAGQMIRIDENNRRLRDASNPADEKRYYDFNSLMSKIVEESQKALPNEKEISFIPCDEGMIHVNRNLFTFFMINAIRFAFLFSNSDKIEMKSERIENEIIVSMYASFDFKVKENIFNDEYYIMKLEAERMNIKIKFPETSEKNKSFVLTIPHHVRGDMFLHSGESLRENYSSGLFSAYNIMLGDLSKRDAFF